MKKMFKRCSVLLLLMVLMAVIVLPTTAHAAIVDSGTCGANLTWTLDSNGTLTISGTGNMYSYTSAMKLPWDEYRWNGITKIIVSPGVTSIGNYGLAACSAETISLPNTITKIGEYSFNNCQSLRQIVLPNGIKSIPKGAFRGCSVIESIVVPSTVKDFGLFCIADCPALQYFIIPDGVKEIPMSMLEDCSGLEYVQIPSSVTLIDSFAFYECGNLTDVYFTGTSSQFAAIDIDSYNDELTYATIHYNSKAPCVTHSYGAWTSTSSSSHQRTCVNCEKTETKSHTWSNACDTSCNDCGQIRTFNGHIYSNNCDPSCNSCGATRDIVHIYSSNCDTSCNVCGVIRTSGSKHTFAGGVVCLYCDVTFGDVPTNSWQFGPVVYVYDKDLMAGKGSDTYGRVKFDPNSPITREEFAQVLYNAEGKPSVTIANRFPDVKNEWYRNAVLWANSKNIANGMGNGNFGVGKNIARQDLALMLYKYAIMKGYNMATNEDVIYRYADGDKVASYAKGAMDWAVTNGVLGGKGTAGQPISTFQLDPAGTATRAECAAMLRNFMIKFNL